MSHPHTEITEYAEELMATPRAHLRMEILQNEKGLALTHEDKTLVECYMTPQGMAAGGFMAKALGAKIPPLGQSVTVRVSTGVLYRAVAIADLDYSVEESSIILERLLEEAEMQRGGASDE